MLQGYKYIAQGTNATAYTVGLEPTIIDFKSIVLPLNDVTVTTPLSKF